MAIVACRIFRNLGPGIGWRGEVAICNRYDMDDDFVTASATYWPSRDYIIDDTSIAPMRRNGCGEFFIFVLLAKLSYYSLSDLGKRAWGITSSRFRQSVAEWSLSIRNVFHFIFFLK